MNSRIVCILLLAASAAVVACSKKRSRRAEIEECSSISLDAKGTTQCLVQLYRWKVNEAQQAAQARHRELDSLKTFREDSLWALDATRHGRDLQTCRRSEGQLRSCLLVSGWPLSRVEAAIDSLWQAELPAHRRELQACMAKRDVNLSSCLTLYYKWDSDRALATADSVARARLGGVPQRR
jgi:hypothetical protein